MGYQPKQVGVIPAPPGPRVPDAYTKAAIIELAECLMEDCGQVARELGYVLDAELPQTRMIARPIQGCLTINEIRAEVNMPPLAARPVIRTGSLRNSWVDISDVESAARLGAFAL